MRWFKSSYSEASANACVEVAVQAPHLIAIRDSKDPGLPHTTVTRAAWAQFAQALRRGALTR
ncbi:DUF397 domain-containing protein [Streptomyces sp. NPDC016845]|uniref:DUF397 domain-containing protein n=1 Tax=Streptomyces sp. NPDC016845 TaxID=3364972 RepID=UPI0037890569